MLLAAFGAGANATDTALPQDAAVNATQSSVSVGLGESCDLNPSAYPSAAYCDPGLVRWRAFVVLNYFFFVSFHWGT